MTEITDSLKLNTGAEIPRIGLGTWQIKDSQAPEVIKRSFNLGYRLIDTARMYGNETGIGQAITDSKLRRRDIFITSKLAPYDMYRPQEAFSDSLSRLGLDYLDLYLIHWPFFLWKKAWKSLEKIFTAGRVRAVGVSNFGIRELEALTRISDLLPAVNQIEITPFFYRPELVEYCQSRGIVVEAYSPLARGRGLNHPKIIETAKRYRKTSAQILLRWSLQHDLVIIPKARQTRHMKENKDIFSFRILSGDMRILDSLNANSGALSF